MHLKVFHDKVVSEPVALVEVLPIVQEVVGVGLANSVNLNSVQVEWDEEQHRKTS